MYIPKSDWIKDFVVRVGIVEVQTEEYNISLSEEMMQLQLMCCVLTNPFSSQFQMEIRLDRR